MTRSFSFDSLREDVVALSSFIKTFVRNPIQTVQREPSWDYQRSAVFLVLASSASALISGILQTSLGHAIVFILLLPFISVAIALLGTVALNAIIRFVHQRQLDNEPLFQVVTMSFLPFLLCRVLRTFAPPVTLIGLAATCALLIVGLTERFQLPRRSVIKIISVFFALYFIYWGVDLVRHSNFRQASRENISDESLKVLDEEFKPSE